MGTHSHLISLVLGGANSGKSNVAERLIGSYNCPKTYIATAQAFDGEMIEKIEKHRVSRGPNWHLIECTTDLAGALQKAPDNHVILLDCITLWITNMMLAGHDPVTKVVDLVNIISSLNANIVIVSNEVGSGIIPETKMGREFSKYQGQINQTLAGVADSVLLVTAGLPLALKGDMPEGLR